MNRRRTSKCERVESQMEIETMKKKKRRFERRLVKYEALPDYMKDNEFILDYYRSEWPLKDAFLSVFLLHNESFNVWTHLGGFVIFTVMAALSFTEYHKVDDLVPSFFRPQIATPLMKMMMMQSNGSNNAPHDSHVMHISQPSLLHTIEGGSNPVAKWPWFVFLAGAMGCLVCSSLSHLLACHSRRLNLFLWRLDYAGISLMIVCSFFAPVYYVFHCHPYWRLLYLNAITVIGVLGIIMLLAPSLSSPEFRSFRASLFVCMGFFGIVPAVHAIILYWDHPQILVALGYEVLMGVLYCIGAGFYVSRVPERWKPGAFDVAGHSHQIFHVFVVAGALAHSVATLIIMNWCRQWKTC